MELLEILRKRLVEKAIGDLEGHGLLEPILADIASKKRDPYSVAERVVDHRFALNLLNDARGAAAARKKR